ncbi:hypothetical protein H2198_010260 [Neophaeococcomyces mojaviensis]|uniref:Uncharacterized protein n=1 Tax=Neophaeococcomyces mojaviensis TaxID=3383035 RepID=A0ACC2ZS77_9EURO|nr:hypothetical protein H2198_010260 [Knufia sp. JES_112]
MKDQIKGILVNCEVVTGQIKEMLLKLETGRLGRRIQWAMTERAEMDKLRSSLESNKTALDITLTVGTISLLTEQKRHITSHSHDLAMVIQQTENIAIATATIDQKIDALTEIQKDNPQIEVIGHEIGQLRAQLTTLSAASSNQQMLRVFADQTQICVKSLLEPMAPHLTAQVSPDYKPQTATAEVQDDDFVDDEDGQIDEISQQPRRCPACERTLPRDSDRAKVRRFKFKQQQAKNQWEASVKRTAREEVIEGNIRYKLEDLEKAAMRHNYQVALENYVVKEDKLQADIQKLNSALSKSQAQRDALVKENQASQSAYGILAQDLVQAKKDLEASREELSTVRERISHQPPQPNQMHDNTARFELNPTRDAIMKLMETLRKDQREQNVIMSKKFKESD